MCPEIHENKTYNGEKADIFSLGVLIYVLKTGKFPFCKATKDDPAYKFHFKGDTTNFWK
jgi:serine/threonine protein kinase